MQNLEVTEINIVNPIQAIGKIFIGDYARSKQYITELYTLLSQRSIPVILNKVMGVYYDNPQETKTENLKSFQGVFFAGQLSLHQSEWRPHKINL